MDPVDLRQMNDPNEARRNMVAMGAERIGWKDPPQRSAQHRHRPRQDRHRHGLGQVGRWRREGPRPSVPSTPTAASRVKCGTQDIGTGTLTLVHMIAAEEFRAEDGGHHRPHRRHDLSLLGRQRRKHHGRIGFHPPSRARRCSPSWSCSRRSRPGFGVEPGELVAADGKVYVGSDPSKSMTWQQATAQLEDGPIFFHGQWLPGYSDSGVPGVHFAEVSVDTETGLVKVDKVVAVHNSGLILNPLTWASQVNGGVLMGIGYGPLRKPHHGSRDGLHGQRQPGRLPAHGLHGHSRNRDSQVRRTGARRHRHRRNPRRSRPPALSPTPSTTPAAPAYGRCRSHLTKCSAHWPQ